jgi:hypothetical protein
MQGLIHPAWQTLWPRVAGCLGAPKVRPYSRIVLVRRQGDHLERAATSQRRMGENQRAFVAHRVWCVPSLLSHVQYADTTQSTRCHGLPMNWVPSSPAHRRTARSPSSLSKVWYPTANFSFPLYSDRIKCVDDGQWGADVFEAHAIGCNAVSWAPAARAGSLLAAPNASGARSPPVKRFASAGCDNIVKIWGFSEETQAWVEEDVLEGHADWVRDVAWAPNIGLPRSYIATASQVSP